MKGILTTVLLCAAIILIPLGIHTNNSILMVVGGIFVGFYNSMVYKQD